MLWWRVRDRARNIAPLTIDQPSRVVGYQECYRRPFHPPHVNTISVLLLLLLVPKNLSGDVCEHFRFVNLKTVRIFPWIVNVLLRDLVRLGCAVAGCGMCWVLVLVLTLQWHQDGYLICVMYAQGPGNPAAFA